MKENQKVNEIVDAFKERGVITAREIREMKDSGGLTDDELHRFMTAANSSGIKFDETDYSEFLDEDSGFSTEESDTDENDVDTQYYSQYEEKIRQYKLLTADEEKMYGKMVMEGKRAEISLNAMRCYRTRIDPERQKDLEKRIRDKNEAVHAFVLHNQKLIYAVASKQCAGKPQLYNDAVQDGNIGLLKAVDNFNPFLGFCFSTYATMWILQSIQSGMFETSSTFTAPSNINHLAGKLRAFSAKYSQTHQGKTAPASYLATAFHISEEKVNMLMGVISTPASLDQHIGSQDDDGDGSTLNDLIPSNESTPENSVINKSLRQELWNLVHSVIDEREYEVLSLRHGIEDGSKHTLDEIGSRLGISREGARQIEKAAIAKLSQNKKLHRIREQMRQSETF